MISIDSTLKFNQKFIETIVLIICHEISKLMEIEQN